MGFHKHWDVSDIVGQLRSMMVEIRSPYNDGFSACYCKQDLYQIKCFIEDNWKDLPQFPDQEREWEQQRLVQKLKE